MRVAGLFLQHGTNVTKLDPIEVTVHYTSGDVKTFEAVLDASTVLMGFGLPDDRLHSPNEKFSLDQFHKGIATSIRFWHEL